MDFTTNKDCVQYLEKKVLPLVQFPSWGFPHLRTIHEAGNNFAQIIFRGEKIYKGSKYIGINIMIRAGHNQGVREHTKCPTISGELLSDDGHNEWFIWESIEDMMKRINDIISN